MNLVFRRSTRTASSEEIEIFDLDSRDEAGDPVDIGKIDVHYANDQVTGTLLLWSEYVMAFNKAHASDGVTISDLTEEVIAEVTDPIGVAEEYSIEVYYPSRERFDVVSSYADDDEEEFEDDFDESSDGTDTNGRRH